MTPEGAVKKEVCAYLDTCGIFYRRMNTGTIRKGSRFIHLCPEGTADLMVFPRYKVPHWIELKAPKGTTEAKRKQAQAAFRDEVVALGHRYAICESVDAVIQFLGGN